MDGRLDQIHTEKVDRAGPGAHLRFRPGLPDSTGLSSPAREFARSMEIYLPIAEMSVHWLIILGMGAAIGFLSGLFGVGGGFLLTPLLIFYGVPAAGALA